MDVCVDAENLKARFSISNFYRAIDTFQVGYASDPLPDVTEDVGNDCHDSLERHLSYVVLGIKGKGTQDWKYVDDINGVVIFPNIDEDNPMNAHFNLRYIDLRHEMTNCGRVCFDIYAKPSKQ